MSYIACVMAFIWRTGTGNTSLVSSPDALWPRIVLSVVLGMGVLYFILIMSTFRRYGNMMDKAWRARVTRWMQEAVHGQVLWDTSESGKPADPGAIPVNVVEGQPMGDFNLSSENRAPKPHIQAVVTEGDLLERTDVSSTEHGLLKPVSDDTKMGSAKDLDPQRGDMLVRAWRAWLIGWMKRHVNHQALHDTYKSKELAMEGSVAALHSSESHDMSSSKDITSQPGLDVSMEDLPMQATDLEGQIESLSKEELNPAPSTSKADLADLQKDYELRKAIRVVTLLPRMNDAPSQTVSDDILHRYQYDSHIWNEFIKVQCFSYLPLNLLKFSVRTY